MTASPVGFHYAGGRLRCDGVDVDEIAAAAGTPAYVYSAGSFRARYRRIRDAFAAHDPVVCYSVKANANLAVLRVLRDEGAGFDIVSGGELFRTAKAGIDPARVVFAGVGKSDDEIRDALRAGILFFDVESEAELAAIDAVAAAEGRRAPVALRVNPDVDPHTHRYISTGKRESKFGVDLARARRIVESLDATPHVDLLGVHIHIGSQIVSLEPYESAVSRAADFVGTCRELGHDPKWLNIGGGYGIDYGDGRTPQRVEDIATAIGPHVERAGTRLVLEPGRFISAPSGLLLTRVRFVKESGDRRFVIVDAAMTDLIRPSLYEAYHRVWPARSDLEPDGLEPDGLEPDGLEPDGTVKSDVVGPVCESADFFAKDRALPPVEAGDLLGIFDAGAYGFVMTSHYNARPRPPEVLVEADTFRVVRKRESYEDLIRGET